MKFIVISLIFGLAGCRSSRPRVANEAVEAAPGRENAEVKIDSGVSVSTLQNITKKATVRQFLASLELIESTDSEEDLLNLIDFQGTESAVNSYALVGGGGVRFTTRYDQNGRAMVDAVFSKAVLDDVVTSFGYFIEGRNHSFQLKDGVYLKR